MGRRKQREIVDAFSGYDLVPVSGVATSAKVRNWSWAIMGGIGLGVLGVLLAGVGLARGGAEVPPPAPAATGRAPGVAQASLLAWLDGRATGSGTVDCVVERGRVFEQVDSVSWQRSVPVSGTDETHYFVVDADGSAWLATVTIRESIDPATGDSWRSMYGCPSLSATSQRAPLEVADPWPGWTPMTAETKFVDQLDVWADAYFSADAVALFRVTGDTDESHSYQPLGAIAEVERTSVTVLALAPDGSSALASVTVRTDRGVFGMDVLFGSPAAALPPVVAWGPIGAGLLLTPYLNAVQDVIEVPVSAAPASTAAATSEPPTSEPRPASTAAPATATTAPPPSTTAASVASAPATSVAASATVAPGTTVAPAATGSVADDG